MCLSLRHHVTRPSQRELIVHIDVSNVQIAQTYIFGAFLSSSTADAEAQADIEHPADVLHGKSEATETLLTSG
jgi:hypothetical protein